MEKFEEFITDINPDAYRTIRDTSDLIGPEELKDRAERLLGTKALSFLEENGIKPELHEAKTNALGKIGDHIYYKFNYMDREVFFCPSQTKGRVSGVSVGFRMDKDHTKPMFRKYRYRETGKTLGNNTLAFLHFLGKFVEKIDNNLIITPEEERREQLYVEFFKKHGPDGHAVFVSDQQIKKSPSGSETLPY